MKPFILLLGLLLGIATVEAETLKIAVEINDEQMAVLLARNENDLDKVVASLTETLQTQVARDTEQAIQQRAFALIQKFQAADETKRQAIEEAAK